MTEKVRANLDRLDTLRDLALYGPEENRTASQQDYEELRSELLAHDHCKGCGDMITAGYQIKDLLEEDKGKDTNKPPSSEKDYKYEWDSNRNQENPEKYPWPEENEAKD